MNLDVLSLRCAAPAFVAALAMAVLTGVQAHGQRFPFGQQHQAYRAGTLSPTNFTRTQQNAHVASYYDLWKSRWLTADPGGQGWRVKLNPTGATVSEGQGYGMVIVAAMAGHDPQAKMIFDGLWQFRVAHPSEGDARLMDWRVPDANGNNSAFDGDMDIAYGLLMAHAQWGSDGAINYLDEAKTVIAGIRDSTIGPQSKLPMLGDWVNPNGSTHSQWTTRSSDFMPGHFRAFGAATGDAAYWSSVVAATQAVTTDIQANESAASGLLPDFIRLVGAAHDPQPAPANFLEGEHDGHYWYNAGRVAWRLGADAVLNDDATTLAQVQKLSQWARTSAGGNADNVRGGYQLNGTALNSWTDHFFTAPFAVAAMTGSGEADQQWLNALYNRVYQAHNAENYYADAVTLQSLLIVTGNFWDPMAVLAEPPAPGEFDGDGTVDGADLTRWQESFAMSAAADTDRDGDSDGADFLAWQRGLRAGGPAVAVPEPPAALLLPGAIAIGAYAGRHSGR
jgi:endoglucanase